MLEKLKKNFNFLPIKEIPIIKRIIPTAINNLTGLTIVYSKIQLILKPFFNSIVKKVKLMFKIENKTVKSIIRQYKPIWAIGHASALMGWDAETYMPDEGINERGDAEGEFAKFAQKLILKKSFKNKVEQAGKEKLNTTEKGIVRELKRDIEILEKLPPKFVQQMAQLTTKARVKWRNAKEKNKFKIFQPDLTKIMEMNAKKADYIGYEKHPYNALLDLYEEGLTVKEMDGVFNSIREPLKKIVKIVKNSKKFTEIHPIENEKVSKEDMDKLNHALLKKFGFDLGRGRLDVSAHPFTTNMGMDDVRITTWYPGKDFKRSLTSTIHEFGHALYEMQISPDLKQTPIEGGVSMGVHESQSRYWENMIGRNKKFIENNFGLFKKHLGFLKNYTVDDVYRYFNLIVPSLIRVEADEVTYNFHVMLRYEIEKELMQGKIAVKDLPSIWNEKMQEYLMVKPKNDSEGVLQDIHWSMGSVGYFPTYTIGTILAAQIANKIGSKKIEEEKYPEIKTWLGEKIHQYGCVYEPKVLVKKALGEGINAEPFLKHVKEKVKKLY